VRAVARTSAAGRLPLQLHRNGTGAVRVQEARRPYLRRHRRAPGPATHRRTAIRGPQAQGQPRHSNADLSAAPTPRAPRCARPLPGHHPSPTPRRRTPCGPLIPCPLSPATWAPARFNHQSRATPAPNATSRRCSCTARCAAIVSLPPSLLLRHPAPLRVRPLVYRPSATAAQCHCCDCERSLLAACIASYSYDCCRCSTSLSPL
jgi:hypothetical protein